MNLVLITFGLPLVTNATRINGKYPSFEKTTWLCPPQFVYEIHDRELDEFLDWANLCPSVKEVKVFRQSS